MHRTALLVLIAVALWVPGTAPGSPIVGVSANTVPQGEFMLDTWFMWRGYTREYEQGLQGGDTEGWVDLPADVTRTHGTLAPRLLYGVTDWLTLRVGIPLEDRYVDDPEDVSGSGSATGLGDLVIDPKIQIYQGTSGYPKVALLAGVQFPTGDSGGSPALSDGSTDYVGGAVITHKIDDVTAHACLTYWLNGESAAGVDVPDLWIGAAGVENPIDESWSLLWETKAYIGSENSKYRRVYVCPGLEWNGAHLTLGACAFVPVYAKGVVNAPSRFDFNWAPYVRLYYRFF
jgi:hypothetical protein